jgi:UDP-2,3-diacylglucosamine pyrophosphatase LpxH
MTSIKIISFLFFFLFKFSFAHEIDVIFLVAHGDNVISTDATFSVFLKINYKIKKKNFTLTDVFAQCVSGTDALSYLLLNFFTTMIIIEIIIN